MNTILDRSKIKRILVVSLSNLGDIILTTPVISTLRHSFPDAHLSVVIGPKGRDLFQGSRTIDKVIIYDKKKMNLWEKFSWVIKLREEKYDLVIDLRNTLIPFLLGSRYRSAWWYSNEPVAMRDKHLFRLQSIGIEHAAGSFDFFSPAERTSSYQKLTELGLRADRKMIAIAPGAGSYLKRWDIEKFSELARALFQDDRQIAIVGSASEKSLGDQIAQRVEILNLCGILTVRELAACLSDVTLLISNDSAIMHLGNELNIPAVSIFGPTNDQKYGKTSARNRIVRKNLNCTPCEKAHCRFEHQACLEDLSSDIVVSACQELLR